MFPPRLPPPDMSELTKEQKQQLLTVHLIILAVSLAVIDILMFFVGAPK